MADFPSLTEYARRFIRTIEGICKQEEVNIAYGDTDSTGVMINGKLRIIKHNIEPEASK